MIRFVALVLTTLTGFSGLVYEVFWQRYLATLLGSHSEATAAVLAIFLGGLSLGYALFGSVARAIARRGDPTTTAARELLFYGVVEAGIGIWAFAFPWLFAAARALSLSGPEGSDAAGFAVDVVISALLIGPPTVLMGGTIPLLTQGLSTGVADATRFHALVYATNTLGAFFGAVIGGFFLLPWLGLKAGVLAMGAINVVAGLTFIALGAARGGAAVSAPVTGRAHVASAVTFNLGAYAVVALLGGFAMMALQTTMNRIGALSFGASHFTFATVVAAFVLCIALGSMLVSLASRIPPFVIVVTQWTLVAYLILLYHSVGNAPYWAHVLRTLFRDTPASFYPYYLSILVGILVVFFVPLALSGASLPLLFHHLRREVDDLGAVAGRLYSWNTVGSLLGALLAGYLFLYWLDLHHIYRLAVVALAAAAAILSLKILKHGVPVAVWGLVLSLAAIAFQPAWAKERLSSGLFGMRQPTPVSYAGPEAFFNTYITSATTPECIFYDDDPVTSVAVLKARAEEPPDLSIIVNGKSDGDLVGDDLTMRLLALIPAMLTDARKNAFIIGLGTGVTAGELATQPSVEKITIAEIAPAVVEAAQNFEPYNGGVLANPKIQVVRSDAYRALLRSPETYDLIISEPSNPWVMGVEMLYAKEFLEAARQRLRPGGVFGQWFHTYSMSASALALAMNTYRQVFPRTSVWYTAKSDIVLIGFADRDGGDDLARISRNWSDTALNARLGLLGIDSLPAFLAHEILPVGVLAAEKFPPAVHTLLHPLLSHEAAQAFFVDQGASLPATLSKEVAMAGATSSLLGRYHASVSEEQWKSTLASTVTQGCFNPNTCMTFLSYWWRTDADSQAFKTLFAQAHEFWGESVDEELLPYISRLFDESGTSDLPAEYAYAEQVAQLFVKHYTHALPFDAGALHGPWKRCAAAGDEQCRIRMDTVMAVGVDLPLGGTAPASAAEERVDKKVDLGGTGMFGH